MPCQRARVADAGDLGQQVVLEVLRLERVGGTLAVAQALDHEQVRARGLLHEVDLRTAEPHRVRVLGSGVHVAGEPLDILVRRADELLYRAPGRMDRLRIRQLL